MVILLQEKKVKEIVLKAMGQAISKTVAIAEIIKVGYDFLVLLSPYDFRYLFRALWPIYLSAEKESWFISRHCYQFDEHH